MGGNLLMKCSFMFYDIFCKLWRKKKGKLEYKYDVVRLYSVIKLLFIVILMYIIYGWVIVFII